MNISLAWKVIDYWVKTEYDGSKEKAEAEDELGNLNNLSLRIVDAIDRLGLSDGDDIVYLSSMIEMELF